MKGHRATLPVAACAATLLAVAPVLTGCDRVDCLAADLSQDCTVPPACPNLGYSCSGGFTEAARIGPTDTLPGGLATLASTGDFILKNDRVVAVFDALDHPHFLAPTGGSLIDLTTADGNLDMLNVVSQATGLLPDDAAHYIDAKIIDEGAVKGVQFRGYLEGSRNQLIATRYEIRPCEPGIRVRSEVINLAPDAVVWSLTDGYFWGKRGSRPFAPTPGAGFSHPSFGLTEIDDVFRQAPYIIAGHGTEPTTSYATVPCSVPMLHGFHSATVTAAGMPRTVVPPRDFITFERFIAVADGGSVSRAADEALELRRRLFGERWAELGGKVVIDGPGGLGSAARASILISEESPLGRIPWTQITPEPSGRFTVRVPAERSYILELFAFGRRVGATYDDAMDSSATQSELGISVGRLATGVGTIHIPAAGEVTINVTLDGQPTDATVFFHPADAVFGAACDRDSDCENGFVCEGLWQRCVDENAPGRLFDESPTCSPLLGPPNGPSPGCNRVLVSDRATVQVPNGRWAIYGTAGPFATLARRGIEITPGKNVIIDLAMSSLPHKPTGALSADFHVHGAISFDSSIPHLDRVRAWLAARVDVIATTEHNAVFDYRQARDLLGADDRLRVITGTESTGQILFDFRPDYELPQVFGHWNLWPVPYDPRGPWRGAAWDQLAEPGTLFTRMEDFGWRRDTGVIQLNHPMSGTEVGRDQGWPVALEIKTFMPLPMFEDGTGAGLFTRTPPGARYNNADFHAQEVMNGTDTGEFLRHRAFWHYLLDQGMPRAGTANSDSHGLTDNLLGTPRNLVFADTTPDSFNQNRFNRAVREGRMVGGNGPVLEVSTTDSAGDPRRPSLVPFAPHPLARLAIKLTAAPWVPVEEIRILINGTVRQTLSAELNQPSNPFGVAGVVRFDSDVNLTALLPADGRDAWVVVEAGAALPFVGDLDCDGVPDTTDNNGDGGIDWRDADNNEDDVLDERDLAEGPPEICEGEVGPIAKPRADLGSPLFHFLAVTPNGYPVGFTNPLLLDRNSDGVFAGPGR